jgi:hypothetical protein
MVVIGGGLEKLPVLADRATINHVPGVAIGGYDLLPLAETSTSPDRTDSDQVIGLLHNDRDGANSSTMRIRASPGGSSGCLAAWLPTSGPYKTPAACRKSGGEKTPILPDSVPHRTSVRLTPNSRWIMFAKDHILAKLKVCPGGGLVHSTRAQAIPPEWSR